MLFSELYKIMVKRVTFVGFRGGDRPNRSPPESAPALVMSWIIDGVLNLFFFICELADFRFL